MVYCKLYCRIDCLQVEQSYKDCNLTAAMLLMENPSLTDIYLHIARGAGVYLSFLLSMLLLSDISHMLNCLGFSKVITHACIKRDISVNWFEAQFFRNHIRICDTVRKKVTF